MGCTSANPRIADYLNGRWRASKVIPVFVDALILNTSSITAGRIRKLNHGFGILARSIAMATIIGKTGRGIAKTFVVASS